MGVHTDGLKREVRMEWMRPAQLDEAMAQRAAVYVPFGSIEWHGRQNVVGLDALKAHEQLVGLAAQVGGVVYPPVYFGTGGCHDPFPHTFMVQPQAVQELVCQLLWQFEHKGFETAILISGHYPNKGEFMNPAVEAYKRAGGAMRVLSIVEVEIPDVVGDHAGKNETSWMMYLHPETVDMSTLDGEPRDIGPADERGWWLGDECKDHPNYGIAGIDPRTHAAAEVGKDSCDRMIAALVKWLDGELELATTFPASP